MIHGQTCNLSLILCSHSSHNLFSPDTVELLGSITRTHMLSLTHTHTHTCSHTHTRMLSHKRTHTHTHTLTDRDTLSDLHTYNHKCTYVCFYVPNIHAHTHAITLSYKHTHSQYFQVLRVHYSHSQSWHLHCSSPVSLWFYWAGCLGGTEPAIVLG